MNTLLQGVAAIILGRGYLSSDHFSAGTGFNPAITISKNGGNFANPAAGASVMTEIESTGWYKFSLGTGDTDTLGPLVIRGVHAAMDNIEVVYRVVDEVTAMEVASQVRTELTTELGRIDAAITSRLASASYTAPANADITAIKSKTDNLPSDPADESLIEAAITASQVAVQADIAAISTVTVADILAGVVEGSISLQQTLRAVLAFVAGKATGGGTTSPAFRDQANTKNRISMTVDTSGNRSAVNLDLS